MTFKPFNSKVNPLVSGKSMKWFFGVLQKCGLGKDDYFDQGSQCCRFCIGDQWFYLEIYPNTSHCSKIIKVASRRSGGIPWDKQPDPPGNYWRYFTTLKEFFALLKGISSVDYSSRRVELILVKDD